MEGVQRCEELKDKIMRLRCMNKVLNDPESTSLPLREMPFQPYLQVEIHRNQEDLIEPTEHNSRMIMTEQHHINPRQLLQIHCRIRNPRSRNSRPQVHMITSMQEIRIRHQANTFPLHNRCRRADKKE
jgi:hypothetical protein